MARRRSSDALTHSERLAFEHRWISLSAWRIGPVADQLRTPSLLRHGSGVFCVWLNRPGFSGRITGWPG